MVASSIFFQPDAGSQSKRAEFLCMFEDTEALIV
jgi:hypothetical protein